MATTKLQTAKRVPTPARPPSVNKGGAPRKNGEHDIDLVQPRQDIPKPPPKPKR